MLPSLDNPVTSFLDLGKCFLWVQSTFLSYNSMKTALKNYISPALMKKPATHHIEGIFNTRELLEIAGCSSYHSLGC